MSSGRTCVYLHTKNIRKGCARWFLYLGKQGTEKEVVYGPFFNEKELEFFLHHAFQNPGGAEFDEKAKAFFKGTSSRPYQVRLSSWKSKKIKVKRPNLVLVDDCHMCEHYKRMEKLFQ